MDGRNEGEVSSHETHDGKRKFLGIEIARVKRFHEMEISQFFSLVKGISRGS